MTTHTPTPWVVEPLQWDHGASLAIVAPNSGLIIATINPDADIQKVDEPDLHSVIRHPQDEPNADFIVRACNAYDDLREALQVLRAVVMLDCEASSASAEKFAEALGAADAALLKCVGVV